MNTSRSHYITFLLTLIFQAASAAFIPAAGVHQRRSYYQEVINSSCARTTRIKTSSDSVLHAKRKRSGSTKNKSKKGGKGSSDNDNASTANNGNSPTSEAANRPMANLAGVAEDHNYEQFFYSKSSTESIYQLVKSYSKPLLLCNPSLAVMAEEDGIDYLLLDRDKRFTFLKRFKEFSLTEPFLVTSYEYDSIFLDPPFANVTPSQLVRCIKLMGTKQRLSAPIFIAYNSKREEELIAAFDELPCPPLTRLWRLDYRSVREEDMNICLYGPNAI